MADFYYLRLCRKDWYPLEEYIAKDLSVTYSRDNPDLLMQFTTRQDAVAFTEKNSHLYPNRAIQILLLVDGSSSS